MENLLKQDQDNIEDFEKSINTLASIVNSS